MIVPSKILDLCENIQKARGVFEYLLPATSSGTRSDPDCDASWTLKNGTVIATTRPYPRFTVPAVHVEDDKVLTDRCVKELLYRMDCISGFSEEIQFHSSDPTNVPPADNGYWWLVLIPIIFLLCLAAILVFCRLRRGRLFGRKEPRQNVDKSSSDQSLV